MFDFFFAAAFYYHIAAPTLEHSPVLVQSGFDDWSLGTPLADQVYRICLAVFGSRTCPLCHSQAMITQTTVIINHKDIFTANLFLLQSAQKMIQSPRQIYIAVDFEFFRRKLIRLTDRIESFYRENVCFAFRLFVVTFLRVVHSGKPVIKTFGLKVFLQNNLYLQSLTQ